MRMAGKARQSRSRACPMGQAPAGPVMDQAADPIRQNIATHAIMPVWYQIACRRKRLCSKETWRRPGKPVAARAPGGGLDGHDDGCHIVGYWWQMASGLGAAMARKKTKRLSE